MLKQFLKHNGVFRTLLAGPLAARSRWISRRAHDCATRYRRAVTGGEVLVRTANIPGQFYVPAASDLAVRIISHGRYEPEVTTRLGRLSDLAGDVVNIGANVGIHAVFLAHHFRNARRIYAVEPNPEAFAFLTRNVALNGLDSRITPIQACIGAAAGELEFAIVPGMPEYSSLGHIVHPSVKGRAQTTIRVPVFPLQLAIGNADLEPSLLLIDTEGAELLVFRGAAALLTTNRPLLLFECSDPLLRKFGHSSALLVQFLESCDYTVRDAEAPRLQLQHPFDGEALGVPREKLAQTLRALS